MTREPEGPRRCGVVGHPVHHSLSPVMHRAAYAELGLDWAYDAVDVAPGALAAHVEALDPSWRALSVTAPHKRDALALAETADDVARRVGGANTLLLGESVHATNTDVPGAVAALRERGVERLGSLRVLGAGATAASVAAAAATLGATRLELLVRDTARAEETVRVGQACGLDVAVTTFDAATPTRTDLLVSTVPAAAAAAHAAQLVESAGAVFDVVYDPWPTPLGEVALAAGHPVVTGLDLLAHQAVLQVGLMTDGSVGADLLRAAARAVVDARAQD